MRYVRSRKIRGFILSEIKYMKASKWLEREFADGSEPDMRTLKKWIEDGVVIGRIVCKQAWVREDQVFGVQSLISEKVNELIKLSS